MNESRADRPLGLMLTAIGQPLRRKEGRQLCQPGRAVPFEYRDQAVPAWLTAKPTQRLQQRLIRFARAVVLYTLAPGCPSPFPFSNPRAEGLNHGCLPDAGFPGDE